MGSSSAGEFALAIPMIKDLVGSIVGSDDIKRQKFERQIAALESKGDVTRDRMNSLINDVALSAQFTPEATKALNKLRQVQSNLQHSVEEAESVQGDAEAEKIGVMKFIDNIPLIGNLARGATKLLGVDAELAEQNRLRKQQELENAALAKVMPQANSVYETAGANVKGE